MRVLLTGATGFIGSHVARALLERGHDVHALVRRHSSRHRIADLGDRLHVLTADLSDAAETAAAVHASGPEGAVHAAWYVEPGSYLDAVPENLEALEASMRLFRLLLDAGCERITTVGTGFEPKAGGRHGGARPAQESVYASTKGALHEVIERLATEGAAVACAHVFYLYGPFEDGRRLVPALIRALLGGEEIEVTDGRQRRDYLHVSDVASALCTIVEAGAAGSIDVCAGEPTLLTDLFAAVEEATGRPGLIKAGARAYGPGEVVEARGDDTVLRGLGWAPSFDLARGVKDAVAWWEDHQGTKGG